jgi:hypothetical protein
MTARSAEPRTQRRARGERTRAHAETRTERRRDIAQKIAAAGAATVIADGAGGIGAQPVTSGVALRIDTLHSETGQILHMLSPKRLASCAPTAVRQACGALFQLKDERWGGLCREEPVVSREKTTRYGGTYATWHALDCEQA